MLFYVQSIIVKWLADVTHQQFQDTCHLRRKPSQGILAYLFIYLFIFILEPSSMNVSGQRNPPRTDLFPTLGHCARFPTLLSRESPERLTAQRLQFQVAPPGSAGGDGKAQCRRLPSGRAFPAGRRSGSSGCSGRSRQTGAQTEACRWSVRRSWNPPGPRTV